MLTISAGTDSSRKLFKFAMASEAEAGVKAVFISKCQKGC